MEKEQLEEHPGYLLEDYEQKYGIENHRNGNNNRFNDLIEVVSQKTGKQVVVLIDEYDAPLLDVAHEKEKLDELRNTMRNFYSPLKRKRVYASICLYDGHHEVFAAQHLQRVEQHHQREYGRALRRHLRHHQGGNVDSDE